VHTNPSSCHAAALGTLVTLAATLLVMRTVSAAPVVYAGYMVDNYCYAQMKAGGRSLDGTDVIRDPGAHTWHCMRDPRICYHGFYLAEKRGSEWHPKYLLDGVGNDAALALLRGRPVGDPRDYLRGEVLITGRGNDFGDGTLRGATLQECQGGALACDTVCLKGNCTGKVAAGTGKVSPEIVLKPTVLLWCHVLFMVVSWGCLLPAGVLWARAHVWTDPKRVLGHRVLQMIGWCFQLLGFICIVVHKKSGHFVAPHEVIGFLVVVMGSLQPLNAQLRHLKGVGHPELDGS